MCAEFSNGNGLRQSPSLPTVAVVAYELGPTHPVRPRRRLRAALFLVGATVLVFGIGAAGVGAWTFQSVRRAEGPARQAAEAFLQDMVEGDHDGAYEHLCEQTRQRMGRAGFAAWLDEQPKVDRFTIFEVAVTARDGRLTATATAELTWASGVVATQSLPLAADDGKWRVCGDPI